MSVVKSDIGKIKTGRGRSRSEKRNQLPESMLLLSASRTQRKSIGRKKAVPFCLSDNTLMLRLRHSITAGEYKGE